MSLDSFVIDLAGYAPVDQTCLRCGAVAPMRFAGPCDACRDELRAAMVGEATEVESTEFVPKMNVTVNAVALKDD